jgi:hypothetical protein
MSDSDQLCLDSLFVQLQSEGWLVVFETVAVKEVVWIGRLSAKTVQGAASS